MFFLSNETAFAAVSSHTSHFIYCI